MPLCENGIRSGIKLFGGLPRGAGGAFGAAAALVNADVVGAAAAPLKMAAAPVVAVDLGLGRGRLVVGSDVAAALAVAVAAADSVPGAGMADVDAIQAAAARLVMAAVILGTIKIAHKNTSVRTVCAGAEGVIHGSCLRVWQAGTGGYGIRPYVFCRGGENARFSLLRV